MIIPLRYQSAHCIPSQVAKKKKRAHARSFWRYGTSLEPDSHWIVWVVGVVQKDPKDKKQGLSPLSIGSFCTILTTLTTLCESGLSESLLYLFNQGNVYESFILFKGELKFTGAWENMHGTNHG